MKAWHSTSWQSGYDVVETSLGAPSTGLSLASCPMRHLAENWVKKGDRTKRKDICYKRWSVYIVSRWWEERRRVGRKKTERRSNAEEEWERTGQEKRVNLRTAVQTVTHFWLCFDQERWVKMNEMIEMQSEWSMKDLVKISCCNMKLAAVALWTQWTQCTLGRSKKKQKKNKDCLLHVGLAVFTSTATDQWTFSLKLFKHKHIL